MDTLRSLVALERLATGSTEPVAALRRAIGLVRRLTGASDVRLATYNGGDVRDYPDDHEDGLFGLNPTGWMAIHGDLVRLGQPAVWSAGEDGFGHSLGRADRGCAGSVLGTALHAGNASLGTLMAKGPWTADAARRAGDLLAAAAPAVTLIFDRVVDADKAQRVRQQMDALSDAARVFVGRKTLSELIQDIVRAVTTASGLLVSLDLLGPGGEILARSVGAHRFEGSPLFDLWLEMTRGPDPVREMILRDRRPVLLPDLQNDRRISEAARRFYQRSSIVSAATLPLIFHDEVVGLMRFGSLKPMSFEGELDVLQNYAAQAAVVVTGAQMWDERARLLRENERILRKERRERERAETLLQVVTAGASTLDMKKILVGVCDTVARISVGDRCSIFLCDPGTGVLEPFMSRGIEDPELFEKFRLWAGAPVEEAPGSIEALRSRTPFVVERVADSPAVPAEWAAEFGTKSMVIYPMARRDRVVGLMIVESFRRRVRFPRHEIETVAAIAAQAAIIIDNARLFEQTQRQAHSDFLTGLPNHRYLQDLFAEALASAEEDRHSLCVAMADVDSFKLLNDVHGHLVGDDALQQIAMASAGAVRRGDIVGRYGGDEFLFILPGLTRAQGEQVMARVSQAVAKLSLHPPGLQSAIPLSISWGVASYPEDAGNRRGLVSRADAGLIERRMHRRGDGSAPPSLTTRELMRLHPETVLIAESLLNVIDAKDRYTSDHSRQHASLSLLLADVHNLPERQRYALWLGGLLHDIGKIGVPGEILCKPGPLTSAEWDLMRQHVTISESIVRGLFDLDEACEAVASHHERYDGEGYPRGLKGEAIPLLGRMLAVVDAYSAMIHDRPYRRGISSDEALVELNRVAGAQLDPVIVNAFARALGNQAEQAA